LSNRNTKDDGRHCREYQLAHCYLQVFRWRSITKSRLVSGRSSSLILRINPSAQSTMAASVSSGFSLYLSASSPHVVAPGLAIKSSSTIGCYRIANAQMRYAGRTASALYAEVKRPWALRFHRSLCFLMSRDDCSPWKGVAIRRGTTLRTTSWDSSAGVSLDIFGRR